MMNPTSPERVRQDSRLIRQTLLKLASPRLLVRAVVIVAAVAIWLYVAQRILAFGATINYQGLHALGQSTVDLLNRINPYLWWAVAIIWSLIVFFVVRGWLRSHIAAARLVAVPADTFSDLVGDLGEDAIDVMRWCWGNRDEPFTVGDLQRTLWEIRHGRVAKIAMVRDQEVLLGLPPSGGPAGFVRGAPNANVGMNINGRADRSEAAPGNPRDWPGERRRARPLVDDPAREEGPVEPRIGPIR
ncbi:hypothetical protein [Bordetella genomosp. 9]|uniref:Uncharacterized protein n=1 Tax=Bordetella genomosp. 9 TaxID=1416803 RepID=A0A1W6YW75_9BORD|nr:hypothetical protein [Bordetella genomosp. 9]ARP84843.1 hypothetical protein CAL13_00320 [Bordetella genomosp. 9]ARP88934.1 hypothetical protein CAL14_00320 [Bordetella genomosp. 9]